MSNQPNYIREYLNYASKNEAPEMFHVWMAYGTISAAIGRRVYMLHGENAIYPNIYVLLVGAAGGGKTTALGKARKLIAELRNVPYTHSVETVEGLIRYMCGDKNAKPPIASECCFPLPWPDGQMRNTHHVAIMANEFIDFIRSNQEAWTGFLNNIYDEDFYGYRTKNMGTDYIEGPYLVLLGAIPTEVSKKLQENDIITTGLARRTIFQYGDRQFHNPHAFPIFTEEEKTSRDFCLARLRAIQELRGELKLTDDSRSWWKNWYDTHSLSLMKRATPATQGWLSSKPNQVQKLAILSSLARSDEMLIRPEDFELGLGFLNTMEESLHMVFGGSGRNELARVANKICAYIEGQPEPVTVNKIKVAFWKDLNPTSALQELRACVEQLLSEKKIFALTVALGSAPPQELLASSKEKLLLFVNASRLSGGLPPLSLSDLQLTAGPSTQP